MISLEGLHAGETAGTWRRVHPPELWHYVRDGLIPNLFPEGERGVYHTADGTLWFFHALHRYVKTTGIAQR